MQADPKLDQISPDYLKTLQTWTDTKLIPEYLAGAPLLNEQHESMPCPRLHEVKNVPKLTSLISLLLRANLKLQLLIILQSVSALSDCTQHDQPVAERENTNRMQMTNIALDQQPVFNFIIMD
jgi:hypothetical protein